MREADFSDDARRNLTTVRFPAKGGRASEEAVDSPAFVPPPLPPDDDAIDLSRLLRPLLEAERSLSEAQGLAANLTNPRLFIGPLIRREAILSSRIENTFATPKQLALFELGGRDQETTEDPRAQVQEVLNYVWALEQGLQDERPLSLNLMRDLHRTLLDGVRGEEKRPGEFRDIPVAIGDELQPLSEATFVPCPPGNILRERLHNLERYINDPQADPNDTPPLVRIAVAHYQFEAIHPFRDGNGRIGRLIVTLQLCRQTQMTRPFVHVSAFFEKHRDEYYRRLLRVSTHEEWTEWIVFFLKAVASQARETLDIAKRLLNLREVYLATIRQKRASAKLGELIDFLFESPWVSAKSVSERLGVSQVTANKYIRRLVDEGVLTTISDRKWRRIFVAREIARVIDPDANHSDT